MSHFTVLVAANDEEHLSKLLHPYSEQDEDTFVFDIKIPKDKVVETAEKIRETARAKIKEIEHQRAGALALIKEWEENGQDSVAKSMLSKIAGEERDKRRERLKTGEEDPPYSDRYEFHWFLKQLFQYDLPKESLGGKREDVLSCTELRQRVEKECKDRIGRQRERIDGTDHEVICADNYWNPHPEKAGVDEDEGRYMDEHGNYGYIHNPQAKWDWYQIGGRWTGLLKLQKGVFNADLIGEGSTRAVLANAEVTDIGKQIKEGKPVSFLAEYDLKKKVESELHATPKDPEAPGSGSAGCMTPINDDSTCADYALTKDVDWEAILKGQEDQLRHKYQEFHRIEKIKDPEEKKKATWDSKADLFMLHKDDVRHLKTLTEDEYVQRTGPKALTWGFVDQEGRWVEQAEMGWWGFHGDVDDNFDKAFWKFVESLDPMQKVYIVDCHI
jgi:hypothetical protein